ncbi:hypothetical protein CEXT_242461 [Caerostris extrusa]|uniref:Uncharacterized protein n=1 Tax=Caerostris extrusa TaxID=172846 RepID=A0AAV4VCB5_CAEEX|nr:hypothetical protein CEXT_242461 [Caerostris extrusa]
MNNIYVCYKARYRSSTIRDPRPERAPTHRSTAEIGAPDRVHRDAKFEETTIGETQSEKRDSPISALPIREITADSSIKKSLFETRHPGFAEDALNVCCLDDGDSSWV